MKPPERVYSISSCENGWVIKEYDETNVIMPSKRWVFNDIGFLLQELPHLLGIKPTVVECCPEDLHLRPNDDALPSNP